MSPERDPMVMTMLAPFVMSARECALEMMSNAIYVQQELPHVSMSDRLRERTKLLCRQLTGTKHDLISELFDLRDCVASPVPDGKIAARVEMIVKWARADVVLLAELVEALEDEVREDPAVGLAELLVTESAGNVLRRFNQMQRAAEAVIRAVQKRPLAGTPSQ